MTLEISCESSASRKKKSQYAELMSQHLRFWYLSHGPQREKTCHWVFGNNKGTDQPAHPRSLIMCIHTVRSEPLLFAWKVSYLDLL